MGENLIPLSDRERLAHLVKSTQQHIVLIGMAKRYNWSNGAEIGVLRGKTLFALLEAVPTLSMIGVDQWKQLSLRPDENAETYVDFDMELLADQVASRAREFQGRCRILRGDSVEMSGEVPDGSFDFVFIDGDHTETGLRRDLLAWAPKVCDTGMVLGHDCHWSTVRRVIDVYCPGWADYGEAVWGLPKSQVQI